MGYKFVAVIGVAWFWLSMLGVGSKGAEPHWSCFTGRIAVTDKLAVACRGIFNSGECARAIETYQKPQYKGRFRRSGSTLRIAVGGRKFVLLQDDSSDTDEVREYSYIEFISEIGQHLIHVQYYENQGFMLVDAKSGKKTQIRGVPILAPSRDRFACYDANVQDGSSLEIWRITASGFQRERLFDQIEMLPRDLVWLSDSSIRVSKGDFDCREIGQAFLIRKGDDWVWDK